MDHDRKGAGEIGSIAGHGKQSNFAPDKPVLLRHRFNLNNGCRKLSAASARRVLQKTHSTWQPQAGLQSKFRTSSHCRSSVAPPALLPFYHLSQEGHNA